MSEPIIIPITIGGDTVIGPDHIRAIARAIAADPEAARGIVEEGWAASDIVAGDAELTPAQSRFLAERRRRLTERTAMPTHTPANPAPLIGTSLKPADIGVGFTAPTPADAGDEAAAWKRKWQESNAETLKVRAELAAEKERREKVEREAEASAMAGKACISETLAATARLAQVERDLGEAKDLLSRWSDVCDAMRSPHYNGCGYAIIREDTAALLSRLAKPEGSP